MALVLHNGRIYTPAGPDVTAMVVDGATVVWLGTQDGVGAHLVGAEAVDLDGALVTPAFVDAHVHATAAGLALTGLDLSRASSAQDVLDAVGAHARASTSPVLLGSGWEETAWPQRRLPTAAELSRASGGRPVYLARVDVHSALVSTELLDGATPRATADAAQVGGTEHPGRLRGVAHDVARTAALALLSGADRRRAQQAFLEHVAGLGVAAVHEMAGPAISGAEDLRQLLALAGDVHGTAPEVAGYWAELDGVAAALELGAIGAAGDLFCDGALGSHTAALHEPYTDAPDQHPAPHLDAEAIGRHVADCTRAGLQAGFHAIGDAAVGAVLDGMDVATIRLGAVVRAGGHRLEHAEMVEDPGRFAASGLLASVQPAFDATWGGPGGMYEQRLGPRRAGRLNDFNALSAAGVPLAFGSDTPVTAVGPWATVRAAAYHRQPGSAISVRAAFAAHTRGGWRAARQDGDGSGVLAVGHPATYAVWTGGDLLIDVPDERVARWSTDPRAAQPGLPDVSPGADLPTCRRTVVRGRTIYDDGTL